jgi:acyl-CoA-binding protein
VCECVVGSCVSLLQSLFPHDDIANDWVVRQTEGDRVRGREGERERERERGREGDCQLSVCCVFSQTQQPIQNTTLHYTTKMSSNLKNDFKSAVAHIQGGGDASIKPTREQQLQFYSLFKQATRGPARKAGKKPSRLRIVAYTKWNAWNSLGNMSKDQAMKKYIQTLTSMDPSYRKNNQVHLQSKL